MKFVGGIVLQLKSLALYILRGESMHRLMRLAVDWWPQLLLAALVVLLIASFLYVERTISNTLDLATQ